MTPWALGPRRLLRLGGGNSNAYSKLIKHSIIFDQIIFGCEGWGAAVLCIVGYLAVFLVSTHQMWVAPLTQLRVTKMSPAIAKYPLRGKTTLDLIINHWPIIGWGDNFNEQTPHELRNGIWHMASVLGGKKAWQGHGKRGNTHLKGSISYLLWLVLSSFFPKASVLTVRLFVFLDHDTLSLFTCAVLCSFS